MFLSILSDIIFRKKEFNDSQLGLHPTVRWTAAAAGPRDINEIWDWRKTQMVADAGFGVHHFKCYGLAAGHFINTDSLSCLTNTISVPFLISPLRITNGSPFKQSSWKNKTEDRVFCLICVNKHHLWCCTCLKKPCRATDLFALHCSHHAVKTHAGVSAVRCHQTERQTQAEAHDRHLSC